MRDLFSQCTCVRAYVHTYVSVTLKNVNLRSTVMPRQDIGYHVHCTTTSRRCFLATEDGEDSVAGPLQHTYLVESSAEASAEHSRRLATLTKRKIKRSVHRRSQESKNRTRKSSTVESTYWRFFTARYLGSLFTLPLFCIALWTPTKRETPDTCAARPTCTWRLISLERRKASYACILLVKYIQHTNADAGVNIN